MHSPRLIRVAIVVLAAGAILPIAQSHATTAIALRSRYRVVLAADSRAVYGTNRNGTECKLFEIGDVYVTVAGLAHYGPSYRATDAVRDGFAKPGTFETRVSASASYLQQRVETLLANLARSNPAAYRSLMQRSNANSDFVELAVAQTVHGQPMLGVIELQRGRGQEGFAVKMATCPGNCRQNAGIFYLGYWERMKRYVAGAGQPRTVGSAASIDRLIRLEINAHPGEVGAPINILELNGSGARWLQNGGNCRLPGVGW